MFGLNELKQTRYFREVAEEAYLKGYSEWKIEALPRLLQLGLTIEQIAWALKLDIEVATEAAKTSETIQNQESLSLYLSPRQAVYPLRLPSLFYRQQQLPSFHKYGTVFQSVYMLPVLPYTVEPALNNSP